MGRKEQNEIETVVPQTGLSRPTFIEEPDQAMIDSTREYMVLQRIKVMQKMSESMMLDKFPAGTTVAMPGEIVIAGKEKPWCFVPLFFYPEYTLRNPIALKGIQPFIVERSIDPRSDLALRAKNPKLWERPHPDFPTEAKKNQRYVESLNFVVTPYGNPLMGEFFLLGFSKASHFDGKKLVDLIRRRNARHYGMVFEAVATPRKNSLGEWYAPDCSLPTEKTCASPWVSDDAYPKLKEMSEIISKAHESNSIKSADEEEDISAPAGAEAF
jgi:hypothetical protein